MKIKKWLRGKGISRTNVREILYRSVTSKWFLMFYWTRKHRKTIVRTGDPIRYGMVCLALEQITKYRIPGSLAEGGVFQGAMSKFIHDRIPNRSLFLFDTFQGFDKRDSKTDSDNRFQDTSEEDVKDYLGDLQNVIIRKGFFPETAIGLENERFVFVMIDFDKYEPTKAALEFFYPRTNSGGFIFVHDYSNPESDWACSRAFNEFLSNKPEKPILIPDACGSALIRKI